MLTVHANVWPRIVVVTGFEAGHGRTTVAINLALTLAREGRYVLLVDADGMGPEVLSQLGIRGGHALTAGDGATLPFCPMWMSSQLGLWVARAGSDAALDAGGLLLQELESEFDAVVVDAPVLSAWSEPSWTSRFADALLLVAHNEPLSAPGVRLLLRESVIPVLGLAVNAAPPDDHWASRDPGRSRT